MLTKMKQWLSIYGEFYIDEFYSLYVFVTAVFAECAYLRYVSNKQWIPFTLLLIGYVVLVVEAEILKGMYEDDKAERTVTVLNLVILLGIFITGCFFGNTRMWLVLTLIPWALPGVCYSIGEGHGVNPVSLLLSPIYMLPAANVSVLRDKMYKFANGEFVNTTLPGILIFGGPLVALTVFVAKIPTVPFAFKILIPIFHILCYPAISWIEDNYGNIYEALFHWEYDPEKDERMKQFWEKIEKEKGEELQKQNKS